jgi:hypothetical protein
MAIIRSVLVGEALQCGMPVIQYRTFAEVEKRVSFGKPALLDFNVQDRDSTRGADEFL